MTPTEWREIVGEPIERRRNALRLSARKAAQLAGISPSLWRQVETGRRQLPGGGVATASPRPESAAAICRVLEWEMDGIDRLLAGTGPIARTHPSSAQDTKRFPAASKDPLFTVDDARRLIETSDMIDAAVAPLVAQLSQLVQDVEALKAAAAQQALDLGALGAVVSELTGVAAAKRRGRGRDASSG